jgi:hypothetical protein
VAASDLQEPPAGKRSSDCKDGGHRGYRGDDGRSAAIHRPIPNDTLTASTLGGQGGAASARLPGHKPSAARDLQHHLGESVSYALSRYPFIDIERPGPSKWMTTIWSRRRALEGSAISAQADFFRLTHVWGEAQDTRRHRNLTDGSQGSSGIGSIAPKPNSQRDRDHDPCHGPFSAPSAASS